MKKLSIGNRSQTINESMTMKRIYSFMFAAVAAFAAASCAQELDNQLPEGEAAVYTASVDGADTKAALDGMSTNWENGDAILLYDGTAAAKYVTSLQAPAAHADFTLAEGEKALTGNKVIAVYPEWADGYKSSVADIEKKALSKAYLTPKQTAKVGTYDPNAAIAMAYTEDNHLEFKNATTLLKFTVSSEDVEAVTLSSIGGEKLTGEWAIDYNNGAPKATPAEGGASADCVELSAGEGSVFEKGKDYYISVYPQTLKSGFAVQFSFKGVSGKQLVKKYESAVEFKRNVILNIGDYEFTGTIVPEEPAAEWAIAGTFNEWSTTANPMELVNGYYVAKNVAGLNYSDPNEGETGSSTGIKFVNNGTAWRGGEGQVTAGTWAYVWGDGGNIYVDGATAETAYDIYLNPSEGDYGKFVIVATGTEMPEDKPATAQEWYLVGAFNGWTPADAKYKMTLDGEWYVFKNFTADGNDVKFVADAGWTINRGGSFIANQAIEVAQGGSNMTVPAGKYDVYLSADAATAYFMTPGLLPGEAPEPEGIYAEEGWVYLKPNSNWTQASARFAIYFFGSGETWVSMTKVEGTNYYGVKITDIISNGYTGMIFCRMNPGAAANNWDNKWNQSGNLKVSDFISGKNCFSVPDGSWDGATTDWSTVEKLN